MKKDLPMPIVIAVIVVILVIVAGLYLILGNKKTEAEMPPMPGAGPGGVIPSDANGAAPSMPAMPAPPAGN